MFKVMQEDKRATVYIYGTIGDDWNDDDANRAKAFAQTLDQLSPKPLDIRIDSPGGDVYEGFAIASAIQRYKGETHAFIDGMAASAASYIALMADRVTMNDFSMIMIHNAWGICIGNRDEMRDMADRLEQIDGTIAGVIAARSVLELDEVKAAMSAETWYRGDDALQAGMCDEVIETERRVAASLDRFMADRYVNVPEDVEIVDEQDGPISEEADSASKEDEQEPGGEGSPIADEQAEPVPETDDSTSQEDAPEPDDDGSSHALSNLDGIEARAAEGAILLGNRVYRKEN